MAVICAAIDGRRELHPDDLGESCPTDDSARALLVQEMRVHFAQGAAQKPLQGIIYFAWDSDPWSKKVDPDSVYRWGRRPTRAMRGTRIRATAYRKMDAAVDPGCPCCKSSNSSFAVTKASVP